MVGLISGLGGLRGFGENILTRNDDRSTPAIDITPIFENGLDFFGNEFNSLFLNNNGSVTFESPRSTFTPDVITEDTGNPEITPFFGDVDTGDFDLSASEPDNLTPTPGGNSTGSNLVYYALDEANDRFVATWDDVGFFSQNTNKLNAFQLILTDRGNNNFDIEFRYEAINWTTGDASGGTNGLGGTVARAGWTAGTGNPDQFFELPASGNQEAILALDETPGNTGEPGRWFFNVRSGEVVDVEKPAPAQGPTAVSAGAPHLFTFDGAAYDFQAAGEFLLVEETEGSLEIQVRQEPLTSNLSVITAVATVIDGQQIMIDATDSEPVQIDGVATAIEDFSSIAVGNGRIFREDNTFTVVYPGEDGTVNDGDERIVVEQRGDRLDVEVQLANDRAGELQGLLGNPDGDRANDIATAQGEVLTSPLQFDELYGNFRSSWLIDAIEESLFTYDQGESPESFFQADFPSEFAVLDNLEETARAEAEQAALNAGLTQGTANFNNAVLDLALTGDNSFLDSALEAPTIPEENIIPLDAVTSVTTEFSLSPTEGAEEGEAFTLTLTALEAVVGEQTVDLAISGDFNDSDLAGELPTAISIADGETTGSVTVAVNDDEIVEPEETVTFTISNPSNGLELGETRTLSANIIDNDATDLPTVTLAITPTEGTEEAQTTFTITATASEAVTGEQTVALNLSGDTDAEDFIGSLPATIAIADGETIGTIEITVNDDEIAEGQETATLTLADPSDGVALADPEQVSIAIGDNENVTPAGDRVFRFFNTETGGHFYTTNVAEREFVQNQAPEFEYEGVAFLAAQEGAENATPVFRFFNTAEGEHFYTAGETERDFVLDNLPEFELEGIGFFAYAESLPETAPIFRFYNPGEGGHFYTASSQERDFVLENLPNFDLEGVDFYGNPISEALLV